MPKFNILVLCILLVFSFVACDRAKLDTKRYKKELDSKSTPQFGLVAEQVDEVNPALVVHDDEGKPYTVRYEAVNAMLLNEFLKAHRKLEEQDRRAKKQETSITELESAVAQQQKEIRTLAATLRDQAAQIQKVSTQLGMNNAAPRLVISNQ